MAESSRAHLGSGERSEHDAGKRFEPVEILREGDPALWFGVQHAPGGLRRLVVLKVASGPEAREELAREATLASHLQHPNLVQVLDVVSTDDRETLVLEFVEGVAVELLLAHVRKEDSAVPSEVAARIVADVALGLAHAHAAQPTLGVVHRDVAPSNILLSVDGFGKLGDFGIARSRLVDTHVGPMVRGTPGYLSPEQASGAPVDGRSDVFSLGAVLFELLSGHQMMHGDSVRQQLAHHAANPRLLPHHIDSALKQLVQQMTAMAPDHRPASMAAVAEQLEEHAGARGATRRHVQRYVIRELRAELSEGRKRLQRVLGIAGAAGVPVGGPARAPRVLTGGSAERTNGDLFPAFDADDIEPTDRDDKLWKRFKRRD